MVFKLPSIMSIYLIIYEKQTSVKYNGNFHSFRDLFILIFCTVKAISIDQIYYRNSIKIGSF